MHSTATQRTNFVQCIHSTVSKLMNLIGHSIASNSLVKSPFILNIRSRFSYSAGKSLSYQLDYVVTSRAFS